MQTETITIEKLDTKPQHDPYVNIEGVVSKTTLKLDPRDHTVWVTQEYQDNSTPVDEWNGLILTWGILGHPAEEDMREWINDSMALLIDICDGFNNHWDGNNHVGRFTVEAKHAIDIIRQEFDNDAGPRNYYETWTVESWMEQSLDEITAGMTDEQLQEFAAGAEPDSSTLVLGDILDYITQRRDELKTERELYGDDE